MLKINFMNSLSISLERQLEKQFVSNWANKEAIADKKTETSPKVELRGVPRSVVVHRSATSVFKRCVDVVGSLVGLTFLAAIFVPVAVAIKLDSPGPIFFSQVRCGLKGKTFRIYKFRSMVSNAEAVKHLVENESIGHIFKNANDPRVTALGRFLRKTSLDEFPQFLNVLKGEMSLVGTRPPTVDEAIHYSQRHWQRLLVKPGLTGEWQANGRSEVKDFEAIVDLDLRYQRNWNELYDLKLIFKTIQVLFSRSSGAC